MIERQAILKPLPVCTLSPTCKLDIVTCFLFSRETVAVEGKHPPPDDDDDDDDGGGGGGGGGGGVGQVQQWVVSMSLA